MSALGINPRSSVTLPSLRIAVWLFSVNINAFSSGFFGGPLRGHRIFSEVPTCWDRGLGLVGNIGRILPIVPSGTMHPRPDPDSPGFWGPGLPPDPSQQKPRDNLLFAIESRPYG